MGGAVAFVVGSYARIVNARSGLLRLGGELCRESMSDGIEIRQPDAYERGQLDFNHPHHTI